LLKHTGLKALNIILQHIPVFTNYKALLSNYFTLSERQKHKRQHKQDESMQPMSAIKYKTSAIKCAALLPQLHSWSELQFFARLKSVYTLHLWSSI